jgi:hypothetical protein
MAKNVRDNPAGPYLRCPSVCKQDLEEGIAPTLLVKSLVHQQRIMQNYRRRGDYRPLARC